AAAATICRGGAAQTPASPTAVTIREAPSGTYVFDPPPPASFRLGDRLRLTVTNGLSRRIALWISGLDGAQAVHALIRQQALGPGNFSEIDIQLNQPGTFALDPRLLDDGLPRPLPVAAFMVAESLPPQVDQDRILLIEDARQRADGTP